MCGTIEVITLFFRAVHHQAGKLLVNHQPERITLLGAESKLNKDSRTETDLFKQVAKDSVFTILGEPAELIVLQS